MIRFIIVVLMVMLFVGCSSSDSSSGVVVDTNKTNPSAVVVSPVKPSVTKVELVPPLPPSL